MQTLYFQNQKELESLLDEEDSGKWENALYRVDMIVLFILGYFVFLEIMQIKQQGMDHFRSFWSWTYVATIIVTALVCVMDFT